MLSRESFREALSQSWPLLPAWCIGTFHLIFAEGMWGPDSLSPNPMNLDAEGNLGVQVLAMFIFASVLYFLAPRLGPYLTAVTSSSSSHAVPVYGSPAGDLGTSIVRIFALLTVYTMAFVQP
ncbi:MAG: hypothetical protein ACI8QC_002314 [Planctomycetota bacterium]|jgi:hypothetical protein